jgi:VWFA-related protein
MRILAPLVIGLMTCAAVLGAQQTVFRSASDTVPVFVTATDKSGRLVPDLVQSDFQVSDNGKPQAIAVFDNRPQPIRLIVLIDISGSMAGNLRLLGEATHELIGALGPEDLARVGTFGDTIAISPTFTRDEDELLAALPRSIPEDASTPLWEAINTAMNDFTAGEGRPVVLVMSDSKDSGPRFGHRFLTQIEIGDRAERENVMIYGVGVRSRGRMMPGAGMNPGAMLAASLPDPGLGTVALDSGGGYFELLPRDDLAATFARVVDELHHQYLLGFAPTRLDGKTHKIQVKTTRAGIKLRARKTYRARK